MIPPKKKSSVYTRVAYIVSVYKSTSLHVYECFTLLTTLLFPRQNAHESSIPSYITTR